MEKEKKMGERKENGAEEVAGGEEYSPAAQPGQKSAQVWVPLWHKERRSLLSQEDPRGQVGLLVPHTTASLSFSKPCNPELSPSVGQLFGIS